MSFEPDFRSLFAAAPVCGLVLAPDLTIVAVTDAYLRATLTTREGLVGRALFEAFPDNPDDPNATGVHNLRSSLERVLRTKRPDTMPTQKYDIRRPEAEGGGFEERYWSPVNSPVLGPDDEITCILHQVEDITRAVRLERRSAEQHATIRELSIRGEERLVQMLDAAPDAMVVVDAESRLRFINAQTEKLFGYSRSELMGQPLEVLLPERFRATHAEHLRRYFSKPTVRTMGSGLELFGLKKAGTEMPIEVSLSPLPLEGQTCVSAAIRDITERKGLEAASKLAATRLASAVESIHDAFALFDSNGRLVLCNSAYRNLVAGTRQGPVVGCSYDELLYGWLNDSASNADEACALAKARRAKAEGSLELDVVTRDGRSLRVLDRRTAEGGTVETIWDLTDDARLAAELREARIAADAANEAKSEFLSSMSHELRTPLNAILGFSQLLQRDKRQPLSEQHRQRVNEILKGGEHLLRLIDDVLDLSRIEAGGVSISTEPVDVLEVLEQVHTTLGPTASNAGITLALTPVSGEVPMIAVDRTRFSQIVMNFGSNAIKYNRPHGSVTFTVSLPSPQRVRVTVSDTGLGIPANKQHLMFKPFQRAGQEAGPIEGTGIGLAISRRLAQLMQGDVGFKSTHAVGSEFWVEMPVHASHRKSTPASGFPAVPALRLAGDVRAVILYVEDNPANVAFMRDLLSTFAGIELVVASTAEEGVVAARSIRPRVIIFDINLPGMSGLDALKILQSSSETAHIPVIALTAAASERDRRRGEQAGFRRYLTKPVRVDELEAALGPLL